MMNAQRPPRAPARSRRRRRLPAMLTVFITPTLWAADDKTQAGQAAEPSLEQLVQLNARALFGGKLKIQDGRFTLQFPGDGSFARGFDTGGGTGRGRTGFVADPGVIVDEGIRKALLADAAGGFSLAGLESGTAVSGFELADEWKITFLLRIPAMLAGARLTLLFNQDPRGKEHIQSNFFQDLTLKGTGKDHAATSKDPRFSGRPDSWFDRRSRGVPVEIRFTGGQLSIHMAPKPPAEDREKAKGKGKGRGRGWRRDRGARERVEVVALAGIESPAGGRIVIRFDRCSFLISDLEVEGKLPRKWLEEELDRLRKGGKLITTPEEAAAAAGAEDGRVTRPRKKGGPDLSKPDTEAEEEL